MLRKFTDQGRDVLVLHVSVCVELTTLCGVGCLHVIHHEVQTALRVAILGVLMAIEHVCFRNLIISLCHQRNLHLVLDLLYGHIVMYSQVREDGRQRLLGRKCPYC